MKVLQISQYYVPHVGGVEKHLQELNQELIKLGHQPTVLTGDDRENYPAKEELAGGMVYRINNQPGQFYKLKIWLQVLKNLNLFFHADIVQVHDVFWWIIPIYPLIARKLFITFHGYEGSQAPSKKAIFWHQLAQKMCRGSLAVGGFHQQFYGVKADQLMFGASNVQVQKNLATNKQKIIFVGRLAEDNGIMTYLEALKILKEQRLNYQLVIYGNGPLLQKAKTYVKEQKLAVSFAGEDASVDQYFKNYALAFVSRYLAIIEALKSGCQVIAHYHNPIKKLYLKSAPFAESIFIEQSAENMAKILAQNLEKAALKKTLASKLSWDIVAKTYLKLWQKKF